MNKLRYYHTVVGHCGMTKTHWLAAAKTILSNGERLVGPTVVRKQLDAQLLRGLAKKGISASQATNWFNSGKLTIL